MDADRNDSNSSDSLTSETSTKSDTSSSESQRSTSSSSRNSPTSSSSSESQRSTDSSSRNSPSSTEATSSRERSSAQTSSSSSRSRTSRDTSPSIDSSSSSASSRDRSSATEETSSQPETSSSRRSSRQESSSPQDSSTRSSRSSMDSSSSEESPTSNTKSSRSPTQDSTTADRDSSSDASPTSSRGGGAGGSTNDSSSDANSPTSSNQDSSSSGNNDRDSSSNASPTSSNSDRDSSSDASPTSSSDGNTGGAADSSSAGSSDENSSSSEDNSSSAASDTSSAGAGGNTESSSNSASSSTNAGAGAAGASSTDPASSSNSGSSTVGGGAAGATGASGSSSSSNGGPTSTSDGAGGSSSSRSGGNSSSGAANANGSSGGSSGSASSNSSSVSNLLSTETSLYVYTTNGSPTTSVVLNTVTLHPKGQLSSDADNNSYWHDHGAVGGTFAAVGIVAVGLLAAAGWFLYRRHKAKRMDADVVAAASAAAATTRTPFDDDDEEMHQAADPYPQTHMESAPYAFSNGSGGAAHSAYYDSPGFHAPDHYANTDLPRNYASLADDPYGSDAGTRENAMRYYPGAAASSSNVANRGAYSDIPSDSAYSYNQPLFDSVPGGPPANREYHEAYHSNDTHANAGLVGAAGLAGAAGAAAAYQDPFANENSSSNSDLAMAPNASQTSGHASSTNDYEGARSHADSHATHYTSAPESVLPYRQSQDSSQSSELRAAPPVRHALEAPYQAQPMDQANYYSDNVSPFDDAPTHAAQASAYHPTDATPAYSAGPYAPAVSDAKVPLSAASTTNRSVPTSASVPETSMEHAQEPTQLVNFSQHSPEVHNELETPFAAGLDRHPSDVTTDRGDWDPPALSSAWFPNGATTHSAPAAPPTTSTHTSQQPMHSTGGVYEEETASVEHTPARLVVRNPSPEDQE